MLMSSFFVRPEAAGSRCWGDVGDVLRPDNFTTAWSAAEVNLASQGTRLHGAPLGAEEDGVEAGLTGASTMAPLSVGTEGVPFCPFFLTFCPCFLRHLRSKY